MICAELVMVLTINYTNLVMESIIRFLTMALILVVIVTTRIIDLVKLILTSMKLTWDITMIIQSRTITTLSSTSKVVIITTIKMRTMSNIMTSATSMLKLFVMLFSIITIHTRT